MRIGKATTDSHLSGFRRSRPVTVILSLRSLPCFQLGRLAPFCVFSALWFSNSIVSFGRFPPVPCPRIRPGSRSSPRAVLSVQLQTLSAVRDYWPAIGARGRAYRTGTWRNSYKLPSPLRSPGFACSESSLFPREGSRAGIPSSLRALEAPLVDESEWTDGTVLEAGKARRTFVSTKRRDFYPREDSETVDGYNYASCSSSWRDNVANARYQNPQSN